MTLTYPRDIFGHRTGTWDDRPSQNWLGWDIFWARVAGQRLNMGGSSGYIDHADAVGSTTMETDPSGAVDWDVVNGPWGQAWQQTGTRQSAVFADLDWQVNDPLIPSATREYSDGLGRWMTPDPGGTKVVNLANPQTWNMYTYVTDNPTTLNDPSGLSCYVNLTGCLKAENNAKVSSSVGNANHYSAPGVNSEQKHTVSSAWTIATTVRNADGSTTTTYTTTTVAFSTAKGHEGEFVSATSQSFSDQTTDNGINEVKFSVTGPHNIGYGEAGQAIGAERMSEAHDAAIPGTLSFFPGMVAADARAHPYKYVGYGLEAGAAVTPLPEAYGAYEGVKAGADLVFGVGHLIWDLTH